MKIGNNNKIEVNDIHSLKDNLFTRWYKTICKKDEISEVDKNPESLKTLDAQKVTSNKPSDLKITESNRI